MATKKNILITGRTGFVGRNLVEYLDQKYSVLAPSRKELDLLDGKAVEKYISNNNIDIVVHAAASPYHRKVKDSSDIAYRNLRIFFNIINNSHSFSKMIYLGSGAAYDLRGAIPNVKEEEFGRSVPEDEHGFAKYVSSRYIDRAVNIVNLRLFGVFGKYEDYQIRFISNAICKAIYNLPITIKQNRVFSYLYIDDLCRMVEWFLKVESKHNTYNAVPGEVIDLVSIAKKVNEISGKNSKIIVHKDGFGKEYTADNSRLRRELSDFQFTGIDNAIRKLYEWYKNNVHNINRNLLLYDP